MCNESRWDKFFRVVYTFYFLIYVINVANALLVLILKPKTFSIAEVLLSFTILVTLMVFDCVTHADTFNPFSNVARRRVTFLHEKNSFLRCSIRVRESASAMVETELSVRVRWTQRMFQFCTQTHLLHPSLLQHQDFHEKFIANETMMMFLVRDTVHVAMDDDDLEKLTPSEFDRKVLFQRRSVSEMPTTRLKIDRIKEIRKLQRVRAKRVAPRPSALSMLVAGVFSLSGPVVHLLRAGTGTSTYHSSDIICICVGFVVNFISAVAVTGMIFEWVANQVTLLLEVAHKLNAVAQPFYRYVSRIERTRWQQREEIKWKWEEV